MIKASVMRWVEPLAYMGEIRNGGTILITVPEGMRPSAKWRVILR
jgi:hypothetical protein